MLSEKARIDQLKQEHTIDELCRIIYSQESDLQRANNLISRQDAYIHSIREDAERIQSESDTHKNYSESYQRRYEALLSIVSTSSAHMLTIEKATKRLLKAQRPCKCRQRRKDRIWAFWKALKDII